MIMKTLGDIIKENTSGTNVANGFLRDKNNRSKIEKELCGIVDSSLKSKDYKYSIKYSDSVFSSYDDLAKLDTDVLAEIIESVYAANDMQTEMSKQFWEMGIAPADLICADYDSAFFSLFWGNGVHFRKDLLIRAIPGHAHSGHCVFKESGRYPNTTTLDVINALIQTPKKYKINSFKEFADRSQNEINDVMQWFENFFSYNKKQFMQAINRNKKPLSNIKTLEKSFNELNMIEGMRGFYFGGNFDNYEIIRSGVKEKYGFEMGGGNTYPVDINIAKKFNISLYELANIDYTSIPLLNNLDSKKRIELFKKLGFIVSYKDINLDDFDPAELTWDKILEKGIKPKEHPDKDIRNVYIRTEIGKGVADDVAIMNAAFLPQTFTKHPHIFTKHPNKIYKDKNNNIDPMSRFITAFFADRIDTLEKDSSVIIPGGQDDMAAKYVNYKFKYLCNNYNFRVKYNIKEKGVFDLVSTPVLIDFTLASAITNVHIHSSQRYFLMKQGDKENINKSQNNTCALNEYFKAVYSNAYSRGLNPVELFMKQSNYSNPNMRIGFTQIPLNKVLETMHERINLIFDPSKRESNLKKYFSNNNV